MVCPWGVCGCCFLSQTKTSTTRTTWRRPEYQYEGLLAALGLNVDLRISRPFFSVTTCGSAARTNTSMRSATCAARKASKPSMSATANIRPQIDAEGGVAEDLVCAFCKHRSATEVTCEPPLLSALWCLVRFCCKGDATPVSKYK